MDRESSIVRWMGFWDASAYMSAPLVDRDASPYRLWSFDDSVGEWIDFVCYLNGYEGRGIEFWLPWIPASSLLETCGTPKWGISISVVENIDADSLMNMRGMYFEGGYDSYWTLEGSLCSKIFCQPGEAISHWQNNQYAIIRVRRDAAHPDDTLKGDALLMGIYGRNLD